MLLTAQRRGEVCTDAAGGTWTWTLAGGLIPADVSKNHDPHRVPLTPMVLEILKRRATATNA